MSWRSAIWISSAAPDPDGCLCCRTGAEAPVLFLRNVNLPLLIGSIPSFGLHVFQQCVGD